MKLTFEVQDIDGGLFITNSKGGMLRLDMKEYGGFFLNEKSKVEKAIDSDLDILIEDAFEWNAEVVGDSLWELEDIAGNRVMKKPDFKNAIVSMIEAKEIKYNPDSKLFKFK